MKYQHITDPTSFLVHDNEVLDGVEITATGSPIGRVLFTKWEPLITVVGSNVTIANCFLVGQSRSTTALVKIN